jgi:hypothetical protein
MAKETKELIERPSFLPSVDSEEVNKYNELMNQYCQPPRLKIIQKSSDPPFKPPFVDKDVIILPQMTKIGGLDDPFSFSPLYFFPSWACWNPYKMKATLPAVREFSFDPNSTIALKAKKFIKEPCPENPAENLRYCQHLNFYIAIHGVEDITDIPVVISFIRGEYKTGENLIGLIQTRKAPMFACRFLGVPADHSGSGENWYGLDIINDNPLWVSELQYAKYSKLSDNLEKLVEAREVTIDHNDSDVPSTPDPETKDDF